MAYTEGSRPGPAAFVPSMRRHFSIFACLLAIAVCAPALAVDFDRDIQQLLTAKCLQCHGQTEPEAGLRLTSLEGATAKLESGNAAVVPGKETESELMRRVS